MKLWFLPHVREGATPAATGGLRANAVVTFRLESPGRAAHDVSRTFPLAGPGDVIGIEARQVLRVAPGRNSRNVEPDFFPLIEFDAPDLPWAYSPTLQAGTHLQPWLTLVVIEADPGVRLERGGQGQSPWILHLPADRARRELPDLDDAWAWAHAQVACEDAGQIVATLADRPDRTLSRLVSPRRLLPDRQYHAAVVPTYRSGRLAGLGLDQASDPTFVTGLEPAWGNNDLPDRLPAYYAWTFTTGSVGDFESLAKRLRGARLDPRGEVTGLRLALSTGDRSLVVDWEAPLRVPGQIATRRRRPGAATSDVRKNLRNGVTPPVLGPSYFGEPWTGGRALAPLAAWAPDLNLTPALRAAAGLGAEVVRTEQDALVAAAKEQLDAFSAAQREGRRRQLSRAFVARVASRVARAPLSERARVAAPLVGPRQDAASNVGVYTVAGRRVLRKTWTRPTVPGAIGVIAAPATTTEHVQPTTIDALTGGTAVPPGSGAGAVLETIPAIELTPLVIRQPVVPPEPEPPPSPTSVPTEGFSPRFSRPMSEPLAERFPELMLPGIGSIPSEGAVLVQSNPAFIEAFLLGANQELNYELLWRGFPSDRRATAFRGFWRDNEIGDIGTWTPGSALGSHVLASASMVLLVRGEIVRRYPSILIGAVPAAWHAGPSRAPAQGSQPTLPAFRGRIGDDVLYAGFAQLTPADVVGVANDTGPAGWYFLLSENVSDPRFGLDPDADGPPTRATLSWSHLTLPRDATYATREALPVVADAGFNPATATAATIANLVRQRPFRAFLHGSLLLGALA